MQPSDYYEIFQKHISTLDVEDSVIAERLSSGVDGLFVLMIFNFLEANIPGYLLASFEYELELLLESFKSLENREIHSLLGNFLERYSKFIPDLNFKFKAYIEQQSIKSLSNLFVESKNA